MKNINVLITSCGTSSAIDIIKSLKKIKRFKINIIGVDKDINANGLYLVNKSYFLDHRINKGYILKIIKIAKKNKIDFIFPIHSKEISIFAKFKEKFQNENIGIFLDKHQNINLINNKLKFYNLLNKLNFDYPEIYSNKQKPKYPVFVKLIYGSSSKNSKKINNKKDLNYYLKLNSRQNFIIQKFYNWEEITIDLLCNHQSEIIAYLARKRVKIKDGKSIVAENIFDNKLFKITKDLIKKLKYIGACNVQVFRKKNKYKFIEINPRIAAGGLPLSTELGINIPKLMIEYYFGLKKIELKIPKRKIKMIKYYTEVFNEIR